MRLIFTAHAKQTFIKVYKLWSTEFFRIYTLFNDFTLIMSLLKKQKYIVYVWKAVQYADANFRR
jgi:hypothetical protein